MSKPRTNPREFPRIAWTALRTASERARRVVLAVLVVGVVFALAGGSIIGLLAVAAVAVVVAARRPRTDGMPSDEQLERADAFGAREDRDEYIASGDGDDAYEEVLRDLLGLVGRRVTVIVGTGGVDAAWRATAMLEGLLQTATAVDHEVDREVLSFAVGDSAAFYLDRDQFLRGPGMHHRRRLPDAGLEIATADMTLVIFQAATDRAH